jgi:hypothetical protein
MHDVRCGAAHCGSFLAVMLPPLSLVVAPVTCLHVKFGPCAARGVRAGGVTPSGWCQSQPAVCRNAHSLPRASCVWPQLCTGFDPASHDLVIPRPRQVLDEAGETSSSSTPFPSLFNANSHDLRLRSAGFTLLVSVDPSCFSTQFPPRLLGSLARILAHALVDMNLQLGYDCVPCLSVPSLFQCSVCLLINVTSF